MSSDKPVGLLTAAGAATRIHGIPKYALPIPGGHLMGRHVAQMKAAGVSSIVAGCSQDSAPIVRQCAPETHTFICQTRTMSETVIWARPYAGQHNVLFGMPDTYWSDSGVYDRLNWMLGNDIDVAVACWRIRPSQVGHLGQIAFNWLTRVQAVVDKDPDCPFEWGWGAVAWKPAFWDCIDPAAPHVGYAIAEALRTKLHVFAYPVDGDYFDCGTLGSYYECLRSFDKELT